MNAVVDEFKIKYTILKVAGALQRLHEPKRLHFDMAVGTLAYLACSNLLEVLAEESFVLFHLLLAYSVFVDVINKCLANRELFELMHLLKVVLYI